MLSISPCRTEISDRFPVASFNIEVPRSRFFEVACATDPRLFHLNWEHRRTNSNFYTTREQGLLRAPRDQTAWILPASQLRRFAGARRIYYALGTYGSPSGREPQFTISPRALDRVPSIALAADFTGRSLDRSRLPGASGVAPASAAYGSPNGGRLRWGGDDVLEAEEASGTAVPDVEYDDGHSPELWTENGGSSETEARNGREGGPNGNGMPTSSNGSAAASNPIDQDSYDAGVASEGLLYSGGLPPSFRGDVVGSAGPGPADPHQGEISAVDVAAYDEGIWAELDPGDLDYHEPGQEPSGDGGGAGNPEPAIAGYEDAAALYGAVGYRETEDAVAAPIVPSAPALDPGLAPETDGAPPDEPPGLADSEDGLPEPGSPYPEVSEGDTGTESVGPGRHPEYQEEFTEEARPPAASVSQALIPTPLDIPEKVRLLRLVARSESGDAGYAAINADREFNDPTHPAYQRYHIGLSWGLIQFTQRSGAIGRVLQAAKRREAELTDLRPEHRFERLFGPDAEELLRVTNAATPEDRVAPVGGALLWEPVWTDRFRAAGAVPHFTWAQNEVAITDYFDPQLRYARWLGLDTPKALAILVDRAIHMGEAGGLDWVMRTVGPVRSEADREAALRALGHADLQSFQATLTPDLPVDGQWSPPTHAALTFALRNLGARAPFPVPDREAMLERMLAASAAEGFRERLERLYRDSPDLEDRVIYTLG